MARATASWDMVDEQLRTAAVQVERARQSEATAAADAERLVRRESELSGRLADVAAAHNALEQELTRAADERRGLEERLAQAIHVREDAERRHQAAVEDVVRLTAREAELNVQLAESTASRGDLEGRLSATEAAFDDAVTRATRERLTSSQKAAEREAELDGQIRQALAARASLEQTLAEVTAALDQARHEHDAVAADLVDARRDDEVASTEIDRLTQSEADLASRFEEVEASRDALERQLADVTEQLQHERAMRAGLEHTVVEAHTALQQARRDYNSATEDIERLTQRNVDLASELDGVHATADTLGRQLADATGALTDAVARAAQLDQQVEHERTSRRAVEQTLADTRAHLVEQRQQLEIQLAQEQLEHETRITELEERTSGLTLERDQLQQSLAVLQDRARQLEQSLDARDDAFAASRAENQRLFDQAGVAMFRCTHEGALVDANRACTTLIGRRTIDEIEGAGFAAAVFEAPQALSWLIERCVSTRTKEWIETTWRRPDGGRLFMRLSARALPSGGIEVIAEDLTRLHVLEERLGQAHRMEAVGRLASEVAITCGSLLGNLQQQGRDWIMSAYRDADVRQQGEQLFEDVGRAAGFLQELAAYSDEQARTPMLVDLNTLVRDLEPVLKNVAGVDVEVCPRDTATTLNVDVGVERVERLLVNLASYGRGRMRPGGRLRIELGTSVVDRHFSAKHPNVRLGLHALIIVTESHRTKPDEATSARAHRRPAHRPGVDFATLQELVSNCGGHLWMNVHPLGEMVAKIRLPLCSSQEQRGPRTSGRERQAAR